MDPIDFLNHDLIRERGLAELYFKALSMNKSLWMTPKLKELHEVKNRHIALLNEKIAATGGSPSGDSHCYEASDDEKKLLGLIWQWEKELYLRYLEQVEDIEEASLKGTLVELTNDQKINIEQLKSIIQRI